MTSFYIKTAGCSANQADSEQMAGLLNEAQFKPVDDVDEADIIIFNTCTVKTPSETAFFKELKEFKEKYPYKIMVIAGCIPQTDPNKLKEYCLVGTKQIHNVVQVVEESLNDNVLKMLDNYEISPLNLPKIRKNPVVDIIPISRGCLGGCTFCKTKSARGNLVSYPVEEIVKEAKKALKDGVKEIWLTSQDCFCYGFDIKTDLSVLLNKLVKLNGDFKVRVGMGNPDHLLKIEEGMIEAYKHEKVFKFLHLPLQAGHNETLKEMKRNYTVQKFRDLVDKFRKEIPELNLMTDVIVGFPSETEEHFWGTLQALRRVNPDSINISRFWARPETIAAEMKQLPGDVVKHRSKVVTDILNNISKLQNERWVGWEGWIIIDEKGQNNQWVGRNYCYKPVVVEGDFNLGDKIRVKIINFGVFNLNGKILDQNPDYVSKSLLI